MTKSPKFITISSLIPWHFEPEDLVVNMDTGVEKPLNKLSKAEKEFEVIDIKYSLEERIIYIKGQPAK